MVGFEMDDAICPFGGTWAVRISGTRIERAHSHMPKQVLVDLFLVPDVLRSPVAIFQNLMRRDHGDDFCYVGAPEERYSGDVTKKVPFPPGYVFVVMVSRCGEIRKWRLEPKEVGEHGSLPEGFSERFGRRIWPAS